MKEIILAPTDRGFLRGGFNDAYAKPCSIQESSIATYDAIWLGVDENRMHLTKEDVCALLPHLLKFATTGNL